LDANTVRTIGLLVACLAVGVLGGVIGAVTALRRPGP
jgi:hypothetical protein